MKTIAIKGQIGCTIILDEQVIHLVDVGDKVGGKEAKEKIQEYFRNFYNGEVPSNTEFIISISHDHDDHIEGLEEIVNYALENNAMIELDVPEDIVLTKEIDSVIEKCVKNTLKKYIEENKIYELIQEKIEKIEQETGWDFINIDKDYFSQENKKKLNKNTVDNIMLNLANEEEHITYMKRFALRCLSGEFSVEQAYGKYCQSVGHMKDKNGNFLKPNSEGEFYENFLSYAKGLMGEPFYKIKVNTISCDNFLNYEVSYKNNIESIYIKINQDKLLSKDKKKYQAECKEPDSKNHRSMITIKKDLKNGNVFIDMGDLYKEDEKLVIKVFEELVKKDVLNRDELTRCILHALHHGSQTSNSQELLEYLKPVAVMVQAFKNIYDHPSEEVEDLIKKVNSKSFNTDVFGTIETNFVNKEYYIKFETLEKDINEKIREYEKSFRKESNFLIKEQLDKKITFLERLEENGIPLFNILENLDYFNEIENFYKKSGKQKNIFDNENLKDRVIDILNFSNEREHSR